MDFVAFVFTDVHAWHHVASYLSESERRCIRPMAIQVSMLIKKVYKATANTSAGHTLHWARTGKRISQTQMTVEDSALIRDAIVAMVLDKGWEISGHKNQVTLYFPVVDYDDPLTSDCTMRSTLDEALYAWLKAQV